MAAGPYSIDPTTYLDDLLSQASPDLMRQMLQDFINQLLSTQADQICDSVYGGADPRRYGCRDFRDAYYPAVTISHLGQN